MGLDQYIFRIKKPKLENRAYTKEEIGKLNLNHAFATDFETNTNLYASVLRYAEKRDYITQFYDMEKIIADYNLPSNSYITMYTNDAIALIGYKENGESVRQEISYDTVKEKYIITKTVPCYFWAEEEVHYWRKNWDLQDWMNTENCEYRILDGDTIAQIDEQFSEEILIEEPTDESALFYLGWW